MLDTGLHVVTGAAGFIGSAFVGKLNAMGIERILLVDDLGTSTKWKNLCGKIFVDYMHKDQFRSYLTNGRFANQIRSITHMGACSTTTEPNVEYLMQNNFRYSCELAEYALKHNIRFIYASSAATYGDGSLGFIDSDEATRKLKPLNAYGFSKQAFDLWGLSTGATQKMVGLKFFNVYGPNEYHKGPQRSVLHQAYQQIKTTGSVQLFKSYNPKYRHGEQCRDFVYIKDCLNVMWHFLAKSDACGIFNLGTGRAQTWNEHIGAIFAALGIKPSINYIDIPENIRDHYQYFTQAETQKLLQAIPGFCFTEPAAAIRDYVVNYLEAKEAII
ncbi:MAG: ADP-glyceromanno-heptose 6-epimerase [Oligoflexia bacterium]|nr:ADP-glyceromanno-heptose 6-epimerase [Oligoflexia bacterium]